MILYLFAIQTETEYYKKLQSTLNRMSIALKSGEPSKKELVDYLHDKYNVNFNNIMYRDAVHVHSAEEELLAGYTSQQKHLQEKLRLLGDQEQELEKKLAELKKQRNLLENDTQVLTKKVSYTQGVLSNLSIIIETNIKRNSRDSYIQRCEDYLKSKGSRTEKFVSNDIIARAHLLHLATLMDCECPVDNPSIILDEFVSCSRYNILFIEKSVVSEPDEDGRYPENDYGDREGEGITLNLSEKELLSYDKGFSLDTTKKIFSPDNAIILTDHHDQYYVNFD